MRGRLEVRVTDDAVRVGEDRAFPYADTEGLAEAFRELAATVGAPGRLLVRIEPPVVQRRLLFDLPPVRAPALAQLVAHDTQRYFRQNGQALVSAAMWIEEGSPPRRIARAVAMEVPLAEAIVEGAARGGFALEDIVSSEAGDASLSLLPPAERMGRARQRQRGLLRSVSVVLLLWMVALAVASVRLRLELRRSEAELARLRAPRAALAAARLSMDSALAMITTIRRAAADRQELSARLAAVVTGLPDSAYLTTLDLARDGSGEISGRARDARRVAATLDSVPALPPSRLTASGTYDTVDGVAWERFTIYLGDGASP